MRKVFVFLVWLVIGGASLVVAFQLFLTSVRKPYQWSLAGLTYTNPHFGLEITRVPGWLTYIPKPYWFFPKRRLIEFHRFAISQEEPQEPLAEVFIAPPDVLGPQPLISSHKEYARHVLWATSFFFRAEIKKVEPIEDCEIQGRECAHLRVTFITAGGLEMESDVYLFVKNQLGFGVGYNASPHHFDSYHSEALQMIESFRFLDSPRQD